MQRLRTQVGIVGGGPAGLLLGQLLYLEGIESIILENRAREYVVSRVRAGVLEQSTVDTLMDAGCGARLKREGMRHGGIQICFGGRRRRIDFEELTGGRAITVYGQNQIVRDLLAARDASGGPLFFEVEETSIADYDTKPRISFRKDGEEFEIACDYIAGCDGSRSICREAISPQDVRIYHHHYPFAWLGILAEAAPSSHELVYALNERGFALFSMRSAEITRLYLQCAPDEDALRWRDEEIWAELCARLATADGWAPNRGAILEHGVTQMRSLMVEPMRHRRLLLAGDAAHIVPPTGAKGLNLAVSDVQLLARALAARYRAGREDLLDNYSDRCLGRAWRAQRFSWWMTFTLHRVPGGDEFDFRRQIAELEYVTSSRAAMMSLAENYTGWPPD